MTNFFTPLTSEPTNFSQYNIKNLTKTENMEILEKKAIQEYSYLQSVSSDYFSNQSADFPFDSSRDNFSDVLPLPKSTCLKVTNEEEYFHANYVPGNIVNYIVTQNPYSKKNIHNFWQIAFEKNVLLIIDLNNEFPTSNYISLDESMKYGKLEVKIKKTQNIFDNKITLRTFSIKNKFETREKNIYHLHFNGWKDKTDLELDFNHNKKHEFEILKILFENYYKVLNSQIRSFKTHVMIHCRAGIGRTGVFLAIDRVIYKYYINNLNIPKSNFIDILNIAFELRKNRNKFIETEKQYFLIYKFLIFLIENDYIKHFNIKTTRGQVKLNQISDIDSSDSSDSD